MKIAHFNLIAHIKIGVSHVFISQGVSLSLRIVSNENVKWKCIVNKIIAKLNFKVAGLLPILNNME